MEGDAPPLRPKIAAPKGELLLLRRVRVRDGTTERATKAKQALEDMSGRDEPTNLGLDLPAAQGRNEGPRDKRRKMAWYSQERCEVGEAWDAETMVRLGHTG